MAFPLKTIHLGIVVLWPWKLPYGYQSEPSEPRYPQLDGLLMLIPRNMVTTGFRLPPYNQPEYVGKYYWRQLDAIDWEVGILNNGNNQFPMSLVVSGPTKRRKKSP